MESRVHLRATDFHWDGPKSRTTVAVLASAVAQFRMLAGNRVLYEESDFPVVDFWDGLLGWQEARGRTDFEYDGGIEGELEDPPVIVHRGADRYWIGPRSGRRTSGDRGAIASYAEIETAIATFGEEVRAGFEELVGLAFETWAADHPEWRGR